MISDFQISVVAEWSRKQESLLTDDGILTVDIVLRNQLWRLMDKQFGNAKRVRSLLNLLALCRFTDEAIWRNLLDELKEFPPRSLRLAADVICARVDDKSARRRLSTECGCASDYVAIVEDADQFRAYSSVTLCLAAYNAAHISIHDEKLLRGSDRGCQEKREMLDPDYWDVYHCCAILAAQHQNSSPLAAFDYWKAWLDWIPHALVQLKDNEQNIADACVHELLERLGGSGESMR